MILIFFRLHLEDVRDDAVNLNVPNEAGEEEILHSLWVEGPEGGEEEEESGEPVPVSWVGLAGPVLQLRHGLVLQALHCVVICKTKCLLLLLFVIVLSRYKRREFCYKDNKSKPGSRLEIEAYILRSYYVWSLLKYFSLFPVKY